MSKTTVPGFTGVILWVMHFAYLAYFLSYWKAALFDCGTPWAFHIPILHVSPVVVVLCG